MPPIKFSHPQISTSLTVDTGVNDVTWSYTLNTATYPTYAGEVVQVLSTAIDNLSISGEVRSVAEMEGIYAWFLTYMQIATQGTGGTSYSEYAVKMEYPERGWTLFIQPIALPGLHYGRDVVVPSWQLQAHILDPDKDMKDVTTDAAITNQARLAVDPLANFNELSTFQQMSAGIGWRETNPFSDPLGVLSADEKQIFPDFNARFEGMDKAKTSIREDLSGIAKQLSHMVEKYAGGDVSGVLQQITQLASKAADPQGDSNSNSNSADHEKSASTDPAKPASDSSGNPSEPGNPSGDSNASGG